MYVLFRSPIKSQIPGLVVRMISLQSVVQEFLAHQCTLFRRGVNFVAIKCGRVTFVSVYISPNVDISIYGQGTSR